MNRIKEILTNSLIVTILILVVIILLPFLVLIIPIALINDKIFEKKYKKYITDLEGKNFFCYNNRKKGFEFIKNEILPNLPNVVEPLFLDGRKIETDKFETKYLSKALYEFKNYSKFPHLLKIRDGKTIGCSLNNELFNCLNQGKDKTLIYDKINTFFNV